MKKYSPKPIILNSPIANLYNSSPTAPIKVSTFSELLEITAAISNANNNSLLFYRGQNDDYNSTLFPSFFRGTLSAKEKVRRKLRLEKAEELLLNLWNSTKYPYYNRVKHWQLMRWSILQHYEVVRTPLLDVTQSLRTACSFAMLNNPNEEAHVYVLALPYYTGRISVNSEEQITNVRLLSICPYNAKRPYNQEGFLVGDDFFVPDDVAKTKYDFKHRMIGHFVIPCNSSFWDVERCVEAKDLYPANDMVETLCQEIKVELDKILP